VDGQRIADRALAALRGATDTQLVVANDPRGTRWFPGLRVVADVQPGLGPLGGLATALESANGAAVIIAAWDMPWIPGTLLRALRAQGEAGAGAVVPVRGAEGRPEPLCAYYAAAALAHCRALLASGERRMSALARTLPDVVTLRDAELARFGDPAHMFASIDSPEELAAIGGSFPEDEGKGEA
jgi:molybdopterin-guanine dinucleotide biosynthesis protein A